MTSKIITVSEDLFREFETSLVEEPFFRLAEEAGLLDTAEKIQKVVDLLFTADFMSLPLDSKLNILQRCQLHDEDCLFVKMSVDARLFSILDQACSSFLKEYSNIPFKEGEGVTKFEEYYQKTEEKVNELKAQAGEIISHLDSITKEALSNQSNKSFLTNALSMSYLATQQLYQNGRNWALKAQILTNITKQ